MPPKKRKIKIDGIPVHCSYDEISLLSKLEPNPDNPNSHPDEQIQLLGEIIKGNGWRDRITVSNRSGLIVKGHGRYMAAIRAGFTKAPVDYQSYKTEADEIADLIADNKIAEFSIIDDAAARELIDGLDVDFDFRLAGMDEPKEDVEIGTGGQALIDQIDAEIEIENQAERTVDEIKHLISGKLDAIAQKNPAELNGAQAVILSSAKNCNDYFILADPELRDFISELKR